MKGMRLTEHEKGIVAVLSVIVFLLAVLAISVTIGLFFGLAWGWLAFAVIAVLLAALLMKMITREHETDDD